MNATNTHKPDNIDANTATDLDNIAPQVQILIRTLNDNAKVFIPEPTQQLSDESSIRKSVDNISFDRRQTARKNILQTSQDLQDLLYDPNEFLDQYQIYVSSRQNFAKRLRYHMSNRTPNSTSSCLV